MIRFTNLTVARGTKRLFEDANLTLFPGHKIGLIGANGIGKSTLFALMRGELHQDAGEFDMPPSWVVAHVAQHTPQSALSAIDYTLDGDRELRVIEAALAKAEADEWHDESEHERLAAELSNLHTRFEEIGGYASRARAAALLSGLGFSDAQHQQTVTSFSGGWRMRLNLAQALMCRSDLLLLDEPTNHLDLDAVMWLEDWLAAYRGTLFLITHDRDFLDAVVNKVVHVENQKLNEYTGNYSTFERTRAMQLSNQQANHEKQQRHIAHLKSYIDRFKAKATKARQAQSRMKTLERMEIIGAAHIDSPFEFRFRKPAAAPRQLLHLKEASLGYPSKTILNNVEWRLFYGDKIGLLGPNGAGKSTLVKTLAGTLEKLRGGRYEGQGLNIGYFAQHQIEQLRGDESALQHMKRLDPTTREQEFRNFLGGFDFRGARADEPVAPFSGGEKARLALALIVWQKPNLLLLDEPTNHLDIDMREALAEALQEYEGTLVVVAHDRHLLKATADQLWLVADGELSEFDGDLDDYKRWAKDYAAKRQQAMQNGKAQQPRAVSANIASNAPLNDDFANLSATTSTDRKAQKREEAAARQQLSAARKPLEKKLSTLESELKALTTEKQNIETWLSDEAAYTDDNKSKLQDMLKRQGEVATAIGDIEWTWLEVSEKLAAMG
jgi:ATP-binding cassette, subfamily F, member 3